MNEIIKMPFGKYKDKEIAEVLSDDQYISWLKNQAWIKDRYPVVFNIIQQINLENQPTPEHNVMQIKWLEEEYCINFFWYYYENYIKSVRIFPDKTDLLYASISDFKFETYETDISFRITLRQFLLKTNIKTEINSCNECKRDFNKSIFYDDLYKKYGLRAVGYFFHDDNNEDRNKFEIAFKEAKIKFTKEILDKNKHEKCCFCGNEENWHQGHQSFCKSKEKIFVTQQITKEAFQRIKTKNDIKNFFCLPEILDVFTYKIELKPSISDEYPSILRKIKNKSDILITKEFNAKGINLKQIKAFFATNKIDFILESEFEEDKNE